MNKMRVIEAASFGGADVLQLKEVPSPAPGKDSLLIDVAAAGVNYLDTYDWDYVLEKRAKAQADLREILGRRGS